MTPFEFIVYTLAIFGLTFALLDSKLFEGFREKVNNIDNDFIKHIFKCYFCFSFWSSLVILFLVTGSLQVIISLAIATNVYFMHLIENKLIE